MTTRRRTLLVFLGGCLTVIGGWSLVGYATSLDEARFLRRLSKELAAGSHTIRLPSLMSGDWEVVCDSHGYDGPFYSKRYNKTFDPIAPPQDGVWGLIFISKDGSYRSASASCRTSGVNFQVHGCTERERAVVVRKPDPEACVVYSVEAQSVGVLPSGQEVIR